ncbi:Na(+)/H(+) antiporter subunit D [Solemya velum gill symbiont]|uniref:Na(+)/H(+) antiporter subunit D n=1 Tax=Solemya velum gill symbiont TaxID=2340 RepID=A0A0B0HAX3_SOVGS|nr:Na(+)/H(+) antiporter subunit D [Solemya velum gill symbiont]KHF25807.1 Na+:H+ antiporter MrpEFGBBCDD, subunit D2 [Solemya velum gill symbiont]OOY34513.1 Na(+)/H(+) antiporter subunit D [Solemya velum gill symbiont]OOY37228.1 Na(+)/H(+) antiporter subunit D [Solemya velum gill symbiont]OOY47127.1 Na(+)/H(+) antiporter subunit D [Solemya velum gill symbiont]OOY47546.1 Na(+)/H(+) antiporter subunit D [Solemya velum gill symbiont]
MSEFAFPPGLIMILGAFLIPFVSDARRSLLVMSLPILTLALVWLLPDGSNLQIGFLDYSLDPVRSSTEGRLFATIFSIMAFAGGLYALKQARTIELTAAFVYAGAAVGVTFAGDLITLFIFWEIMALGSTLVIWAAGTHSAYRASMRYLLVHLLGGVILMSGIVAYVIETGSTQFVAMTADSTATWLILAGFLVNAGAPPLSAWIADAYPEASPSGTVFLSAFTTKTAVFALLVGFPGTEILIWIGLYMVFYGIIYALLENDMRRILAYSIVNQVGFMVTAIGIGTEMALNGAAAHAFAHIIYKALLLMSAGSVLMMTGKRKCTDLGGLFQSMPLTAFHGIVGALAISAFPFTSGFVTKSLETSAAAHEGLALVWMLLLAASAGVFLHAGIKFPWFVFFQKDSGLRPPEPPVNLRMAMWIFSFLCIAIGIYPDPLYAILPYAVDYQPYTIDHLVTQLQLLLFAGFAFFVMLKMMKRTLTISLDFDWFYRKFFKELTEEFSIHASVAQKSMERRMKNRVESIISNLYRHHGPTGILSRVLSTGSMVMWVAILLCLYLLSYYF